MYVNKVPGKPKMNVITFQKVDPVPCARIPVKLRFAKIQTADAPLSLPLGGVAVAWAAAGTQIAARATANRHSAAVFLSLLNIPAF